MSYDIGIKINGSVAEAIIPREEMPAGGTYVIGGSPTLELNVTYNYSKYFYKFLDEEKGIRWIYGQKVADTIPMLKCALFNLEDEAVKEDRYPSLVEGEYNPDDYWCPCAINAAGAIRDLLALAEQCPEGEWFGD